MPRRNSRHSARRTGRRSARRTGGDWAQLQQRAADYRRRATEYQQRTADYLRAQRPNSLLAEQVAKRLSGPCTLFKWDQLAQDRVPSTTGFEASAFAYLAGAAYKALGTREQCLSGSPYTLVPAVNTTKYFAVIDVACGLVVLSCRGTEVNDLEDLRNDKQIATAAGLDGVATFQEVLRVAERLRAEYPQLRLVVTGHSLGGTKAAFVAGKLGCPAVTFAIGTGRTLRLPGPADSRSAHFVLPGDIVARYAATALPAGSRIVQVTPRFEDVWAGVANHGMVNFLTADLRAAMAATSGGGRVIRSRRSRPRRRSVSRPRR